MKPEEEQDEQKEQANVSKFPPSSSSPSNSPILSRYLSLLSLPSLPPLPFPPTSSHLSLSLLLLDTLTLSHLKNYAESPSKITKEYYEKLEEYKQFILTCTQNGGLYIPTIQGPSVPRLDSLPVLPRFEHGRVAVLGSLIMGDSILCGGRDYVQDLKKLGCEGLEEFMDDLYSLLNTLNLNELFQQKNIYDDILLNE
ncbi:hypothetical protein TrVE_jg4506 [Triparma verrucosa]|uniref:Uncharacterized protein n=1 Tax=Triparma verrucosa TaxID=1606542 RepID=A0A9W7FFI3_9STRA|nr:hypothetical protein TrVE_jg4506 [Triparma verrucosa]